MNGAYTLEGLFSEFPGGICVPSIQRGYVQGRDDSKGEEIRANFVPALVSAVFGGDKLSLDFVYGVASGDGGAGRCLLPLDGQQRLSSLFLLAWLCGKWKTNWRFDYKARRIPQFFVDGLRQHRFGGLSEPSLEIRDSAWFLPVWENDPTVAGMLRFLDALHETIGQRNREDADFGRVTFLLHGIDGKGETFDHIFRKMNARGKELSPWENLKAMLDKFIPENRRESWRRKMSGFWDEAIWKQANTNIANLDNAMEKIVRMSYARLAGPRAYSDSLYTIEKMLSPPKDKRKEENEPKKCFSEQQRNDFYSVASTYFASISSGETPYCWGEDRTINRLWTLQGEKADDSEFWVWLFKPEAPSVRDMLRMAFLAEVTCEDDKRRRKRVLLNLLDASTGINDENFDKALLAGLDYLKGELDVDGITNRKAGFSPDQLGDEKRKWALRADRVVEFEKHVLVNCGSLQFIGWSDFADEDDVQLRLKNVKTAIDNDWIGFYHNLASRIPMNEIVDLQYVYCPTRKTDFESWRKYVLSSSLFVKAVNAWHDNETQSKQTVPWVEHLCDLLKDGKATKPALRKINGWMFLLQNLAKRSPKGTSIRLDRSENEKENRISLLEEPHDIYYSDDWPWKKVAGEDNAWVNVECESWIFSNAPTRFMKHADGTFISRRCQILSILKQRKDLSDFSFIYYSSDGKRHPAETPQELDRDWDWASIFRAKNSCAIELIIDRQCQHYLIGIARLTVGDAKILDEKTIESLLNVDRSFWTRLSLNQYWHVFHYDCILDEKSIDDVAETLAVKLDALQQAVV